MRIPWTRTRVLGIAAVAALVWSVGGMGSAAAAGEVTELGWWTRNPLSSAPDGGFAVGAAPDGVTAVAAVRVDVGDGVETLVLEVAPASDGIALGSLEVCVAPDTWSAATAGALDDAPATTCDRGSVPFAEAGDGWRSDVSSLVQGASGTVSLAVVPVAGSGTVPFEVTFTAPSARATGGAGPASPTPAPAPSSSPAPAPRASTSPSLSPPPSPRLSPPSPAPAVTTPPAPAASAPPAAPEPVEEEASSSIELAAAGVLDDVAASDPRWGEALVLVLIGLGVGVAVYGTSRVSAARAGV